MEALTSQTRLKSLDGLRGAAILGVFFYHYAGSLGAHTNSHLLRALGTCFGLGWSGVDLFFVLSGFLITGILFDTRNSPHFYRTFYVRRALRIFPIFYLGMLIVGVCAIFLGAHWNLAHLLLLVYVGYPAAAIWPSIVYFCPQVQITHIWSLCIEEQYYIAWPFLLASLRSPSRIVKTCFALAVLALGLRIVLWSAHVNSLWLHTFLFCRLDGLALGSAIAIVRRSARRTLLERWAPHVLLSGATLLGIEFLVQGRVSREGALVSTVGYTTLGLTYAALLVMSISDGSIVQKIASVPVLRSFGKSATGCIYTIFRWRFSLALGKIGS